MNDKQKTGGQNLCKSCKYAKDVFRESCFCAMYGIIFSNGKAACAGYEQIRKPENNGKRDSV